MAKLSYDDWKALCLAFNPDDYHNKKACSKALCKLWSGFQNVKGNGVFDPARHNEMVAILEEVSKKKEDRWGKW